MSTEKTSGQLLAEIDELRARLAHSERALHMLRESSRKDAAEHTANASDTADLSRRALLSVIEDQQRANEAIRTVQARLDGLLSSIDQAVWSIDALTHEVRYVNRATGVIYGRPLQDFYASHRLWLKVIVPEDVPVMRAHDRRTRDTGRSEAEFRIRRPDGEVRWTRNSAVLVRDDGGRPLRLEGMVADITGQKLAQLALAESEQQFRGIVELSITGVYIIQDEKFVYVNPRLAELMGYAPDEMIGRNIFSMVPESERARVTEYYRRHFSAEAGQLGFDTLGIRKDGSTFDLGLHGTTASYHGRPAIIGLMQDITEKKRAAEQKNRYLEQIQSAFMRTVEVAMNLSEMRDPYTAGHERRVAEIAVAIGTEMGLKPDTLEGLRVAGYLHDVGKISIPAEMLSKPGKLSANEFNLIKSHAEAGYTVLKDVEFPWPVAQVALQHHERIDGSGYPQGLKGEAILLESRIMAVADVMEAMSSHRPYRAGLGIDKALAEIERGRGTAYDSDVADACLRLFREKHYSIPA